MAVRFVWEKLGLVFAPGRYDGRPWMTSHAQAPATLMLEDRIRVYFSCRPLPDSDGQFVSYSAFVDLDREDPTRVLEVADAPILSLGSRGAFDEFGTYPVSVVRDGDDVVAYYGGWTRCESVPFNVAIGCARSTDGGRHFQRAGPGPVLSYSPNEPFVLSGPKIRRFGDLWYLFYIAGTVWLRTDSKPEPVYRIRMATSRDGLEWQRENRELVPPRLEENEAQASPDVFWKDGRYHMFFCYRRSLDFRGRAGGYRIGYASSTDLLHWTRDDDAAGLDVADDGWDSEMVAYPHVFESAGTTYLAYLGNGVGREGFGLARLTDVRED
ncbi:glycosylase [Mycobacterium paragordonae]|uniref:glycosylase n=1 Tax=Mycobacterium paragordonae TaxID=1389713 RepID=UPI001F0DFAAB|nr:glycosylase [Mycobacterium paragordonae]